MVQFSLWNHREPGMPELVVSPPHTPSFLFFLFNSFSKLYLLGLLKASVGLEFFPCSRVSYSWNKH